MTLVSVTPTDFVLKKVRECMYAPPLLGCRGITAGWWPEAG